MIYLPPEQEDKIFFTEDAIKSAIEKMLEEPDPISSLYYMIRNIERVVYDAGRRLN